MSLPLSSHLLLWVWQVHVQLHDVHVPAVHDADGAPHSHGSDKNQWLELSKFV